MYVSILLVADVDHSRLEHDLSQDYQTLWLCCGCLGGRHESKSSRAVSLLTFAYIRRQVEDSDDRFSHSSTNSYYQAQQIGNGDHTDPTSPFPMPLKKPLAPSFSAPSSGFIYLFSVLKTKMFNNLHTTTPSTPLARLLANASAPAATP